MIACFPDNVEVNLYTTFSNPKGVFYCCLFTPENNINITDVLFVLHNNKWNITLFYTSNFIDSYKLESPMEIFEATPEGRSKRLQTAIDDCIKTYFS